MIFNTVQRILGSEKAAIERVAERITFECWEVVNGEKVKGKYNNPGDFDWEGGEFSPKRGRISTLSNGNVENMWARKGKLIQVPEVSEW